MREEIRVTKELDRRFRHVGRIKRAWGTTHKPTIRAMEGMMTGLFTRGYLDILRGLQDKTYSPLQVYDAYRTDSLERLPSAKTIVPLVATMREWIRVKKCSEEHRASLRQSLRYIEAKAKSDTTVNDLPGIVSKLDATLPDASFNKARSAAQAFLRSTLKRSHPLWIAVTDIEPHTVTTTRKAHPQTVEQLASLAGKLNPKHAGNLWGMALSSMGPKEYWKTPWNIAADRIHIAGSKTGGRDRDVPLIQRISMPYATPKAFAEALKDVANNLATPYDMRRSYANILEAAGIIRARRKMYMGHGKKDTTDLYERHEVATFLVADAEKLRDFIGATGDVGLKLVRQS